MFESFKVDFIENFNNKPIIIILDEDHEQFVKSLMNELNIK